MHNSDSGGPWPLQHEHSLAGGCGRVPTSLQNQPSFHRLHPCSCDVPQGVPRYCLLWFCPLREPLPPSLCCQPFPVCQPPACQTCEGAAHCWGVRLRGRAPGGPQGRPRPLSHGGSETSAPLFTGRAAACDENRPHWASGSRGASRDGERLRRSLLGKTPGSSAASPCGELWPRF